MASNSIRRLVGPVALTTTYTTNVYNPAAGTYAIVRHVHVANKLNADTFRLYLGASAGNVAGTELFFDYPVTAKGTYDWYGALYMVAADFLVGGAATTLTEVITLEGELGVV